MGSSGMGAQQLTGPIVAMPAAHKKEKAMKITDAMKDEDCHHKIRMARADYRLFGTRQRNRLIKEAVLICTYVVYILVCAFYVNIVNGLCPYPKEEEDVEDPEASLQVNPTARKSLLELKPDAEMT